MRLQGAPLNFIKGRLPHFAILSFLWASYPILAMKINFGQYFSFPLLIEVLIQNSSLPPPLHASCGPLKSSAWQTLKNEDYICSKALMSFVMWQKLEKHIKKHFYPCL